MEEGVCEMMSDEIDRRFSFYPADTEDKKRAHARVRTTFKDVAHMLDTWLPDGREKALVFTALEEAMFYANAAVARPERGIHDIAGR